MMNILLYNTQCEKGLTCNEKEPVQVFADVSEHGISLRGRVTLLLLGGHALQLPVQPIHPLLYQPWIHFKERL